MKKTLIALLALLMVGLMGFTAFGLIRFCTETDGDDAFCISDDNVLYFGTDRDASISYLSSVWTFTGDPTIVGDTILTGNLTPTGDLSITGNLSSDGATVSLDGSTSIDFLSAGHVDIESPSIRLGLSGTEYMLIATTQTSSNVVITHPGKTPTVTWTATSFDFVGALIGDGLTLSGDAAINGGDLTSSATQILVTTNDDLYRYMITGLAYDSAVQTPSVNGLQVQNGQPLACVGLDGGAAEIGSTEGYVSLGDTADFLRFVMPIPALWADDTQTASLAISFDLHEQAAEECNIDVKIYEYGNITAIVTDTIAITDGAARAWNNLVTLSTGFGAVTTLTGDDSYLVIEITATANADDFYIYGARLKYRVGLQATL